MGKQREGLRSEWVNRYSARIFYLSTTAILWGRQGMVGKDSPIGLMKPLWFREVRWLTHGHTASPAFLEDKVGHGPEAWKRDRKEERLASEKMHN